MAGEIDGYNIDNRVIRKDGQIIYAAISVSCVRRADGSVDYFVALLQDITERKRAEFELLREVSARKQSEEQLRLFIEHSLVALAMFDRNMIYLNTSRRWLSDYNLGERELRGLSHYEVFPEIPEHWKAIHQRALAGEVLRNDNDRFVRADGSVQWIRWEVRPWYDATGNVAGIMIFSEDITERK
jgi:PAS domain S-box-containing protein